MTGLPRSVRNPETKQKRPAEDVLVFVMGNSEDYSVYFHIAYLPPLPAYFTTPPSNRSVEKHRVKTKQREHVLAVL